MAHNEKSAHRQFAIELMGRLLSEMERKKPTAVRKLFFFDFTKRFKKKLIFTNLFILQVAHGEHDYGSMAVLQNGHGEDRDSENDEVHGDVEQNAEFQPDKVLSIFSIR